MSDPFVIRFANGFRGSFGSYLPVFQVIAPRDPINSVFRQNDFTQTPLFERKNSFRCLESNFHRFQPNFDQTNLERFDRDSFPASSESSRLTLRKASRAKQPQISAASRRLRKNSWWSCISWIVDADVLREE